MFNLKNESKKTKIFLAICCTILFSLIMISIFYYGNSTLLGNFYAPNNDDVKFIRSAWILANTGNYTYHKPPAPTVFMMPGLPYTLAFLMKIFGEFGGIVAFRIVQAVIQVLSLLLIFFIARKLFNSKTAIIAVIIDITCIAEVWIPNLVLTETFFKFFVLLLVYFSIYAIEKNQIKYYILGGLALGFAALFRPTIVTYPIIILIMWIIKKIDFKSAVKYTLSVILVFSIIMSPWWIRNYSIFHKFIPLTMATGNPMYQGTYINYNQSTKATDGLDYTNYNTKDPKLSELERNEMEIAASKYRLKNLFPKEPFKFIYWYTIGKGWIQINSPFYWKEIFGISFSASKIYHKIILLLGLLGMIIFFKNKNKNILAIVPFVTIIYFILVYLPFYTMGRYFYPAMPYLIMFSAESLGTVINYLNRVKLGTVINHRNSVTVIKN
ncbi:MAG: glycosyltransferase family 39 protein [Bacillota bacterium]|nr:glycosyltransferase family 39 protein [Bacillota bacterium]